MKRFSIWEAATESYRQAFRRPVSTTVWGLLMVAPSLLIITAMIPQFMEISRHAAVSEATGGAWQPDFADMMRMQMWSWLANLLQIFVAIFVYTAMIRAVFTGRRGDSWAFLRVSMDELYVFAMSLCIGFGLVVVGVAVFLCALAIGAALWRVDAAVRVPLYILLGVGGGLGFLLLMARLALMVPACVKYQTFAFAEGWRLGRGRTWPLFATMLLILLLAIAVSILGFAVFMILIIAIGGGLSTLDPATVEMWFVDQARSPTLLIVIGLVLLIPIGWLQGLSGLMGTAPFARVVHDLATPKPVVEEPAPGALDPDF